MLYNFATDSISEYSLGMWYLAIYMTPHLKQQERNNGVWGAGLCHKHFCHISGGGGREFFSKGIGGSSLFPYTTTVTRPLGQDTAKSTE